MRAVLGEQLALLALLTTAGCGHGSPLGNLGGASGEGGAGSDEVGQLEQLSVAGFPHEVDVYATQGAKRAIVILHGGGGQNWEVAGALGLNANLGPPSQDSIPWLWLEKHSLTAVFPQGFALDSAPLAFTWTNHVMDSGQDDVGFLKDLAAELREKYDLDELYLMGHSNGGMMANLFWCEAPGVFDGYIGVAGPASIHYEGGTDCEPEQPRPYLGLVGDADGTLQVSEDTFDDSIWEIDPVLVAISKPAFIDPRLLGELGQHGYKSQLACDEATAEPERRGEVTTYSNCSGQIQLKRVHGGGHLIFDLEEPADFRTLEVTMDFIDSLPEERLGR